MSDWQEIVPDRSVLRITGEDAETFLENLVTCQVAGLETGEARFGGLLTPQGKILFDFFLIKMPEGYLVDLAENLVDEFEKRLTFYKLRAKVAIERLADKSVLAFNGTPPDAADVTVSDPRHADLGHRAYGTFDSAATGEHLISLRMESGVPEGGKDFDYGDAYPHEVLMDQFAAVDFKKGCYVGQEVVSRMQHRGSAKKRVVKVLSEEGLPPTGTEIRTDGKPAGRLGTTSGNTGLALLRLDRVAEAQNVEADGIELSINLPDWVSFKLPEQS